MPISHSYVLLLLLITLTLNPALYVKETYIDIIKKIHLHTHIIITILRSSCSIDEVR